MTPSELAGKIEQTKAYWASMKDKEAVDDPYDPLPDLWEALELMGTALEKLELMISVDGDVGFLTVEERAELLTHTAEMMTFLDQWKNDLDEKATGEVVEYEEVH